jgi:hypothetical protein
LARRVSVPGADELFRRTVVPQLTSETEAVPDPEPDRTPDPEGLRAPSGRVRHDEKMTVYVTADELLELEHARLSLRRAGLSVDRGRLVREAVAIALADLEANGDDSVLVHRLTQA